VTKKPTAPQSGQRAPRGRAKKPTVSDVAARAGVSTATVSRCLSNPKLVRPELRKQVEAAIDALGYVLYGAAKALKTDRTETIGVIVPTLEIGSFASAIQALQHRLSQSGYTAILAVSDFDAEKEAQLARSLAQRGVDGMMLIGQSMDTSVTDFLDRVGIPHVNTWNIGKIPSRPFIGFDNRAGLRRITDYVLDRGHRDLVFVVGGGPHANLRTKDRIAGFNDALCARGLDVPEDIIFEMPYDAQSGQIAFDRIWSRPNRPTAIVCASDILALGVLRAARARGLSIPRDVSLTGFDGVDIMSDLSVAVTSMSVPAREMGEAAAAFLLDKMLGNGEAEAPLQEFPCNLVEGASVRDLRD